MTAAASASVESTKRSGLARYWRCMPIGISVQPRMMISAPRSMSRAAAVWKMASASSRRLALISAMAVDTSVEFVDGRRNDREAHFLQRLRVDAHLIRAEGGARRRASLRDFLAHLLGAGTDDVEQRDGRCGTQLVVPAMCTVARMQIAFAPASFRCSTAASSFGSGEGPAPTMHAVRSGSSRRACAGNRPSPADPCRRSRRENYP